jgi:hypothetical protein
MTVGTGCEEVCSQASGALAIGAGTMQVCVSYELE